MPKLVCETFSILNYRDEEAYRDKGMERLVETV